MTELVTTPSEAPQPKSPEGVPSKVTMTLILGGAAFLGGLGLLAEYEFNAESRDNAAAAQACMDAYPSGGSNVSESAVKCMQNGWVPGTRPVYGSEAFVPSTPSELVEGYIMTQNDAGNTINVFAVGVWATLGAIGGFWAAAMIEGSMR